MTQVADLSGNGLGIGTDFYAGYDRTVNTAPLGVINPMYRGEVVLLVSTGTLYRAMGASANSWVEVTRDLKTGALIVGDSDNGSAENIIDVASSLIYTLPTAVGVASTRVPATMQSFYTIGYASTADKGGAGPWVRVASEPAHPGKLRDAYGAWYELQTQTANVKVFGAKVDGITNDSAAVARTLSYLRTRSGAKAILFPTGTCVVGAYDVVNTGFILDAALSDLIITGEGREFSIISAATNTVEVFSQSGAARVTLLELTMYNPAGPLQNQSKAANLVRNGTLAQNGNAVNAAWRQYEGAGLTIRRVKFWNFNMCVAYKGVFGNDATLSGDLSITDTIYQDYCFGCLPEQPRTIVFDNIFSSGCRISTNSDSTDDGHALYVTNRPGGVPEQINVGTVIANGDHSSPIKIRKGKLVIISGGCNFNNTGRGIEIFQGERVVIHPFVCKLGTFSPTDTGKSCLELTDCQSVYVAPGSVFDITGVDAWGLRMRADSGASATRNCNWYIGSTRFIQDYVGNVGKAPIIIGTQSDGVIDHPILEHVGTIAGSNAFVDVRSSTRITVINPAHYTRDGAPTDQSRLASFDSGCVDCTITYRDLDLPNAPVATNTVTNSGTNTSITRVPKGYLSPIAGASGDPAVGYAAFGDVFGFYRPSGGQTRMNLNGTDILSILANRMNTHINFGSATDGGTRLGWSDANRFECVSLAPRANAPANPFSGMIANCDGTAPSTTWGTGGAGIYAFIGSGWTKL